MKTFRRSLATLTLFAAFSVPTWAGDMGMPPSPPPPPQPMVEETITTQPASTDAPAPSTFETVLADAVSAGINFLAWLS